VALKVRVELLNTFSNQKKLMEACNSKDLTPQQAKKLYNQIIKLIAKINQEEQ
jgi:CHAT domain-containing protein